MDPQAPLTVAPIQPPSPAAPPSPASSSVPSAAAASPAPAPFLPAAPRPETVLPPTPPAPPKPPAAAPVPTEPPTPAQPPRRSNVIPIIMAILGLFLLGIVAVFVWQRVAPRSASVLPDFIPGQTETTPTDPDVGGAEDSPEMCTLDAMECPDGTMVGRSGPDCAFICPDGQSYGGNGADTSLYESLNDTSEGSADPTGGNATSGQSTLIETEDGLQLPDDERDDVAFDNTYYNPTYSITYKFPTVLDVRDTKPYPRSDILFRHGFFDTDINIDDGYVEASSLSLDELIEKTKQEHPESTAIELSAATYSGDTWKHYAFVQGILTHEHIFIQKGEYSFHLWSSGLSYRISHFAEDIRFTN